MTEDSEKGIPTAAYEGEANLGANYVQKLKSTHPLPEIPDDDIHELVRRQDVVDLIDTKLDKIYEEENNASYEEVMAVAEFCRKILEEVQQPE